MRHLIVLSILIAGAAACASRAPRTTLSTSYVCGGDRQVHHTGGRVIAAANAQLTSSWQDKEGRHFVSWPTAATTMETVEYVIPSDARADALERVYDTSQGTSRADWRLVNQTSCTANGGYTDALFRFSKGKSFDQVAQELELTNKREARSLVRHALASLMTRMQNDR